MRISILRSTGPNKCSRGSQSRRNARSGFTVISMATARKRTRFSMDATQQLMEASYHGLLSDCCPEFSHKKPIFSALKTVDLKWNLISSGQGAWSPGNNFQSLIHSRLKPHFTVMTSGTRNLVSSAKMITFRWELNSVIQFSNSITFGSKFNVN